ncbi:hypothetical protein SPSIL_008780 [Sporomusa silvacetica DSM 10669]|uniref:DUF1540 domain-containing protein n=1 Tax=Sporomusa silvacetica DSM 10669 TaxID=1123289 RepID=A0ABZ3IH67_9FIRM|nr:hypothetical protein [Sporomusa silvacetica]OZC13162.1 hypothetical protein SPSIL_56180 [Sporomusa silvacetica DSM 10669]
MKTCVMGKQCDCVYNSLKGCTDKPAIEGCPPVCMNYEQRKQYKPSMYSNKPR